MRRANRHYEQSDRLFYSFDESTYTLLAITNEEDSIYAAIADIDQRQPRSSASISKEAGSSEHLA
jgi:hypothetical protein